MMCWRRAVVIRSPPPVRRLMSYIRHAAIVADTPRRCCYASAATRPPMLTPTRLSLSCRPSPQPAANMSVSRPAIVARNTSPYVTSKATSASRYAPCRCHRPLMPSFRLRYSRRHTCQMHHKSCLRDAAVIHAADFPTHDFSDYAILIIFHADFDFSHRRRLLTPASATLFAFFF